MTTASIPNTFSMNVASYLRERHLRYARSNPQFSLRAFAKKLGLSPGGLSQILARRKRLSLDRAIEIATRLNLSPEDKEVFLLLVQIEATENQSLKAELITRLVASSPEVSRTHQLTLDQFRLISDWSGFGIYEFCKGIAPGSTTARQIAKHFGITLAEANSTLERLERLELITRSGSRFEAIRDNSLLIESNVPSETIRRHYQSVLTRAEQSVQTQTPAEKVVGTEAFCFNAAQIEEARQITENYFNEMKKLAERSRQDSSTRSADPDVYQLFVNFFRLNEKQSRPQRRKT